MFKSAREEHDPTQKGDTTRSHILSVALKHFRKRGFERTTMRDIARAAKISLGAAYYYFPSKEALVHAFYNQVQESHRQKVEATLASSSELLERLQTVLASKLDVVSDERALLGALFRYVGDAEHPLSVFGAAAREEREAAIATFARALDGSQLTAPLHDVAARALWLAHLGLLLHFIHDRSEGQAHTRRLATQVAQLCCAAVRLAALPGAATLLKPLLEALAEAGLTAPPLTTTEIHT